MSSAQRTCSSEYRISVFSEINHHHLCSVIPPQIRLACMCAFHTTFLPLLVRRVANVLLEIFLCTPQLLKNSKYKFFVSGSSPIDVVIHRHVDNTIFEFRLNTHRLLDLLGATAVLCPGKISTKLPHNQPERAGESRREPENHRPKRVGPKGGGRKGGGPLGGGFNRWEPKFRKRGSSEGWKREGWGPKGEGPKNVALFSLSCRICFSFPLSLVVFSKCEFGLLWGHFVQTPLRRVFLGVPRIIHVAILGLWISQFDQDNM